MIVAEDLSLQDTGYIPMPRLSVSKAHDEFPEIVNRAAADKERTILSRRGKDVAAVVPMEDFRLLERLTRKERDRQDVEAAHKALAERGRAIPLRKLMKQLGD